MHIKNNAGYLGVLTGDMTPQHAFAPAVQKAMLPVLAMQHWNIHHKQHIALLEVWIQPLLGLPASVISLDKGVVASVKSIYHVALRHTHSVST